MSDLTEKLDDLVALATKRMQELNVAVEALQVISDLDPKGIGCRAGCKCMGCIARRALAEIGEGL